MRPRGRRAARALAAFALAAVVLTGCGSGGANPANQPRDGRAGITLSGTIADRQVSVRDGAPELVFGACDPATGTDDDVCVITQTVVGDTFVLVFENPALLTDGALLDVAGSDCRGDRCETITGHAVVDVQVGEERVRARGGQVLVEAVEPLVRYRGEVRLELPDGRVSGDFDVIPRDD